MNSIDPNKDYSINEIHKMGILGLSQITVMRKILDDVLSDNYLQVESIGKAQAKRYRISGANLQNYLKNTK